MRKDWRQLRYEITSIATRSERGLASDQIDPVCAARDLPAADLAHLVAAAPDVAHRHEIRRPTARHQHQADISLMQIVGPDNFRIMLSESCVELGCGQAIEPAFDEVTR